MAGKYLVGIDVGTTGTKTPLLPNLWGVLRLFEQATILVRE